MTKKIQLFEDLKLKDDLLRAIYSYGFEKPLDLQARAILPIIGGRDLIAQSAAGTGKTTSYGIAILQNTDPSQLNVQVLILTSFYSLTEGINDVITRLGEYLGINVYTCTIGNSVEDDVTNLKNKKHIVIGTPDRIKTLIILGALRTNSIKSIVLDEIMSRHLKIDLYYIMRYVEFDAQIIVTTKTISPAVIEFKRKFMHSAVKVYMLDGNPLNGIRQFFVNVVEDGMKFDTLMDLYETLTISQVVIFCNIIKTVDQLSKLLMTRNFIVSAVHENMSRTVMDRALGEFLRGNSRTLVTTDIIAGTFEFPSRCLLINYDIPRNAYTYMRRVGISGKFYYKGVVINFATNDDISVLDDLESTYETQISEMPKKVDDFI